MWGHITHYPVHQLGAGMQANSSTFIGCYIRWRHNFLCITHAFIDCIERWRASKVMILFWEYYQSSNPISHRMQPQCASNGRKRASFVVKCVLHMAGPESQREYGEARRLVAPHPSRPYPCQKCGRLLTNFFHFKSCWLLFWGRLVLRSWLLLRLRPPFASLATRLT